MYLFLCYPIYVMQLRIIWVNKRIYCTMRETWWAIAIHFTTVFWGWCVKYTSTMLIIVAFVWFQSSSSYHLPLLCYYITCCAYNDTVSILISLLILRFFYHHCNIMKIKVRMKASVHLHHILLALLLHLESPFYQKLMQWLSYRELLPLWRSKQVMTY